MIKLQGILKFIINDKGRTSPIQNGYRPLFKFGNNYVSGAIMTENETTIKQGEEKLVDVYIHSENLVGKVLINQIITLWEPPIKIGELTVCEVIPILSEE